MRSGLTTLLLLIPILAVPMLAIFGIPNFAPAVASPLDDTEWVDPAPKAVAAGAPPATTELAQSGLNFSNNPRQSSDRSMPWPGQPRAAAAERTLPLEGEAAPDYSGYDHSAAITAPTPRRLPAEAADPAAWPGAADGGAIQPVGYTVPSEMAGPPKYERRRDSDVNAAGFESGPPRTSRPPRTLAPAAPTLTWQAAVSRLRELEISNFKLEPGSDPNQFLFRCSFTPPDQPRLTQRFEAEAAEPLKAVEKVLAQVEVWRTGANPGIAQP